MKRRKIKLNKKRFLTVILVILSIIATIMLINRSIKKKYTKQPERISNKDTIEEQGRETQLEQEIEKVEEVKTIKIDFLANVTEPVYKKSEKNIKIPVLIYHNFRTPIPYKGDVYKLFSSQENFEENVTALLDAGYTFITLEDLYRYNKGEIGLPEKVIIITVDDGQVGCYTDMFPVLKKYNIPATIFIINKLVGTPDYFSWDQAKEMYDTGLVKIHSHGYAHLACDTLTKEQLISDYTKSHKEIEEHMGESVQKIMAYPAGKSSENTKKWLKQIGFEVQVQTRYGTVNKSKNLDLLNIGRIRGERATGKQILKTINAASAN